MCKGASHSSKAAFAPEHWNMSMHRPGTPSSLGMLVSILAKCFHTYQANTNAPGGTLALEFSPYIWKSMKSKRKKPHLFLPAELATPILREFKNKTCLWKRIDRMITCFKGTWQLIGWKTDKIKASQPFPWGHPAGAPQASGNFQDSP